MEQKLTITSFPFFENKAFFSTPKSQSLKKEHRFFSYIFQNQKYDTQEFVLFLDELLLLLEDFSHLNRLGTQIKKVFQTFDQPFQVKKFEGLLSALFFQWPTIRLKRLRDQILFFRSWLKFWMEGEEHLLHDTPLSEYLILGYETSSFVDLSIGNRLFLSASSPYWMVQSNQTVLAFVVDWFDQLTEKLAVPYLRGSKKFLLKNFPQIHPEGSFFYLKKDFFSVC